MTRNHWVCMLVMPALAFFCSAQGCPSTESGSISDLTAAEQKAIQDAFRSVRTLTPAASAVQSATGADVLAGQAARTVGTCPQITANTSADGTSLTIAVDFGSGCAPVYYPSLTCSGGASGTLNVSTLSIVVAFNQLACGGDSVNGTANLTFGWTGVNATLAGAWDLAATIDGVTGFTAGDGACAYDGGAYASGVTSFDGTARQGSDQWTLKMTDVWVSFYKYANFIPYSGEIILSSPVIRQLKFKFDADSPTTRQVQVSIGGGRYVAMDLEALMTMLTQEV